MKENVVQLAFNRGLISKLALARVDLKRSALSAETMTNWMPRVLGSMMLRPGLAYVGETKNNSLAVNLPFVFSYTDKATVELTDLSMRVRIAGQIVTRPPVSTTVANGDFTSSLASWTDSDEVGATSTWISGGYMQLLGTGTKYAKRDQQVTVSAGDVNTEHALHIHIARGPVELKVGTSQGDDTYLSTRLGQGEHSLAFDPTGNFWIRFQYRGEYTVRVESVNVEPAGDMDLTTVWGESVLKKIRYDQSGDIIFCAAEDTEPQKIERRSTRSWSVAHYHTNDGPFRLINTSQTTMAPSAINGDISLTSSSPVFEPEHVGALFSVESTGQEVKSVLSSEDSWTDPIRVTGIASSRIFTIIRAGVSSSTITLQRSVESLGDWEDVVSYTNNATVSYDDNLDNQVVYYRIGIKAGDYGTDTATLTLRYPSGSITGIARVTGYSSTTSVTAIVVKSFGGTDASKDWAEGIWSTKRGFPSSVAFYEGRLFWAGKDRILGSVSDSFYSFDETVEGDSAPIVRSIGSGPVDYINWLIAAKTLLVGGQGAIKSARSSSLEEPLTTSNFNLKDVSTQGAAPVAAIKIDKQTLFLQASGIRSYEVSFDAGFYEYDTFDVTALVPEVGEPSVTKIAVQRQPDTRVHHLRSDGKVAILIYDKVEEVKCWVLFETAGFVEDVVVLPGDVEDEVYYTVRRTINGATKRHFEQWTLESTGKGAADTRLLDAHIVYSGASTYTISGLSHLEGEEVYAWGNSKVLGPHTVSGGQITLDESVTWCAIGLSYVADFKTAKPALSSQLGTSLLQKKNLSGLGVMLANTHTQGLLYGPDFTTMDNLPTVENGAPIDLNSVKDTYDEEAFTFPGVWDTDSRLCLRAVSPRPCTILAAVMSWNSHERS